MRKAEKFFNLILPILSVALLICIWAIASALADNEFIVPSVGETLESFFELFGYAAFYSAILGTLSRSLIAFALSFLLATLCAVLSYKSKTAERLLAPFIAVVRALPTIAVVLLLLVWTSSEVAPVAVTSLVVFPTSYTNIKNSLSEIDVKVVEMCRLYVVNESTITKKVRLPMIFPPIIRSAGSGISLNLKLMVAAEVLSQTANSIGYLLNTSKVYFEIPRMLALVLVSVIIGSAVELVFNALAKSKERWK